MPRAQGQPPLRKELQDVGVGLVLGAGSTFLMRLVSGRGRVARAAVLATVAASATLVRRRFAHPRTTTYTLAREVDHNPAPDDDHV